MASREISDLLPDVAEIAREWSARLHDRKISVLVYCTHRSAQEQDLLHARGRVTSGPRVTNAQGWQSWHQMRRAWDAVPIVGGKPNWAYSPHDPDWEAMAEVAAKLGIEWAGSWKHFREYCHFQVTGGLTLAAARTQIESGDWRTV